MSTFWRGLMCWKPPHHCALYIKREVESLEEPQYLPDTPRGWKSVDRQHVSRYGEGNS